MLTKMNDEINYFYAEDARERFFRSRKGLFKIYITTNALAGAKIRDNTYEEMYEIAGGIGGFIAFELLDYFKSFDNFIVEILLRILLSIAFGFLIYKIFKAIFTSYIEKKRMETEEKYEGIDPESEVFLKMDKHNFYLKFEDIKNASISLNDEKNYARLSIDMANKSKYCFWITDHEDIASVRTVLSQSIQHLDIEEG